MFSIPEQVTLASKAVFEAQLVSANAFAQAAFDSGATLAELNLNAFKNTLAAVTEVSGQWLTARDSRQLVDFAAGQSQRLLQLLQQQLRDYGNEAATLAQESRARFARIAEAEGAASREKVGELLQAVKSAPAAAVAPLNTFMKTAFAGAQEGYDRFAQAGKAAGQSFEREAGRARQAAEDFVQEEVVVVQE